MAGSEHNPTVLVPFTRPDPNPGALDFFLYLRPETNGVDVESVIFSVVRSRKDDIELTYLANIPGEFIARHNIVERHYALRVAFARAGASAFSDQMRSDLSAAVGRPWGSLDVIGAYDALERLHVGAEDLFAIRVPAEKVFDVAGQVVKEIDGLYVVNYDIPALLRRDRADTDIAVMAIRARLDYAEFFALLSEIRQDLIEKQLFNPEFDLSRAVHVCRGPVEQLADARDYLVAPSGTHLGIMWSPFARFLKMHGFPEEAIAGVLDHPIAVVEQNGTRREVNLVRETRGLDYAAALRVLNSVVAQRLIPGGPTRIEP